MGISVKVFAIENEKSLVKIPFRKYERLMKFEKDEILPQFANQKVKFIHTFVLLDNREPIRILRTDYFYLEFDGAGKIDQQKYKEEKSLAINSVDFTFISDEDNSNIIDAAHIFNRMRYEREYRWTPTEAILNKIDELVFKE